MNVACGLVVAEEHDREPELEVADVNESWARKAQVFQIGWEVPNQKNVCYVVLKCRTRKDLLL